MEPPGKADMRRRTLLAMAVSATLLAVFLPGAPASAVDDRTVSGTVVDGNGAPLAGIEVTIGPIDEFSPLPSTTATTGTDGTFNFTGLARDLYSLDFADPTGARVVVYDPSWDFLNLSTGDATGLSAVMDLVYSMSGVVLAPDGTPAADVNVAASGPSSGSALTGPDGTWRIDGLLPGSYELIAADPSLQLPWTISPEPVVVADGDVSGVVVNLVWRSISGTVTGTDGTPLAGIVVTAGSLYETSASAVTGADGTYRIDLLWAIDHSVSVEDPAAGYLPDSYQGGTGPFGSSYLQLQLGDVTGLDFVLERARTISGTVVDEAGAPLAGRGVFAASQYTTTGPDGSFVLRPMPVGEVAIEVFDPTGTFPSRRQQPFIVDTTAGDRTDVELVLVARYVEGIVVDLTGEPIAGVVLEVVVDPDGYPRGVSGADGSFRLGPLPPERFRFDAADPLGRLPFQPHALDVDLSADDATGLVVEVGRRTIRGTVVDGDTGEAVPDLYLLARSGEALRFLESTMTGADGAFELVVAPRADVRVLLDDWFGRYPEQWVGGAEPISLDLSTGDLDLGSVPVFRELPSNTATAPGVDGTSEVTVTAPEGTTVSELEVLPLESFPDPPPFSEVPEGLISFDVGGVEVGGTVVVDIEVDPTVPYNEYWKIVDGQWVDATSIAEFPEPGLVRLTLVDGGFGDADGVANGVIDDPGAPAVGDRTGPTVAITGVADGDEVVLDAVPEIACVATDDGSGVAGECEVAVTGGAPNGVGEHVVTATATDQAGNTSTVTATFRVVYRVDVLWPLDRDELPVLRSLLVPVRIRLTDATGTVVSPAAAPVWLQPVRGGPLDGWRGFDWWSRLPELDAAPTDFVGTGRSWTHLWWTGGLDRGWTYELGVELDDGTVRELVVGLG